MPLQTLPDGHDPESFVPAPDSVLAVKRSENVERAPEVRLVEDFRIFVAWIFFGEKIFLSA